MTVYELLRKCAGIQGWRQGEQEAAAKLIDDLERMNVFGTTAAIVSERPRHGYKAGWMNPNCQVCGEPQESREHE